MWTRRSLLMASSASLLAAAGRAHAAKPPTHVAKHYELRDIRVPGTRRIGRRFTLLVPKRPRGPLRLLVLLHGLGETGDERMGAHAWVERYGLGRAYDRLCEPPVAALERMGRHWHEQRLLAVNDTLEQRPFGGLLIACPYTPNVYKARSRKAMLDDYADWLVDTVIPRARSEAPTRGGALHTGLDGCSLGGYVGIEVFLRKAKHFGAWGSVQGALGAHRVHGYAERLASIVKSHGPRAIHLETSEADAFRAVNEKLSRELRRRGVAHDFRMPPGPHNQPFLRDSGSLEMLLWHDRLG
jgi:hypothetical protein